MIDPNADTPAAPFRVGPVQWGKSEHGYVRSKCGRFQITPQYWGRVQPMCYQIEDSRLGGFGRAVFDTQKLCKEWAERKVNPPVEPEWPEITEDML